MFKGMSFSYHSKGWVLVDDNFSKPTKYGDAAAAIMEVYPPEDILPNLKIYFSEFYPDRRKRILQNNAAWDYSELNFKKYYPCLKRYIERLEFIGK